MITAKEILMGRDVDAPLSKEQVYNLFDLLPRVNYVRFHWGKPLTVSSGYRPATINTGVGGAKQSAHITCQAVDFKDEDGDLARWLLAHQYILKEAGLFMEDPRYTPSWVHLQSRRTLSLIFKP